MTGDADARPPGGLVWIHCPDQRRFAAVLALARRLEEERDAVSLLVTGRIGLPAGTPRNLRLAVIPSEARGAAQGWLDHWRPDMLLWMGGALLPVLLGETARTAIPMLLVEADAAGPVLSGVGWRPGARRAALQHFDRALALDGTAKARLRRLGIPDERIEVTGALDDIGPLPGCHERDRGDMARAIGARPVWLVAGAVPGEIDSIAAAHRQAIKRAHRLLLLIAPARESDAPAMASALRKHGFLLSNRGDDEEPDETTEIYLADGPGEIGLWYRLSPITLMGGTMSGRACRDPLEPAALGSAVLHGMQPASHDESFARLAAAGACRAVRSPADLGLAVEALLAPDRAAALARAAWDVSSAGAEATNRVIDLIRDHLERDPR